jgi:hypothetical protein
MRRRMSGRGLQGYTLHPGAVYSNIADRGLEGQRLLGAVRRALAPVERRMLKSTEQGAQTSVVCATDPRAIGGRYYRDGRPAEPSADAQDAATSTRVWALMQEWLATVI